jgi:Ca2+/H+ antiporter, TMEM165/GDT1 family
MDAMMTVLAAVLLANADGRAGALLAARRDRKALVLCFLAAFLVLAAVSAAGAVLASNMLGLGVLNLFAALALGSAAAALLWTRRAPLDAEGLAGLPVPMLFARLLLIQLGDRNQFLIFALGALSGAALWGAAGALVGLLIAISPVLALGPALLGRKGAKAARWAAAGMLILWAALHLRRAFGV